MHGLRSIYGVASLRKKIQDQYMDSDDLLTLLIGLKKEVLSQKYLWNTNDIQNNSVNQNFQYRLNKELMYYYIAW